MASIHRFGDFFVLTSGNKVDVHKIGSDTEEVIEIQPAPDNVKIEAKKNYQSDGSGDGHILAAGVSPNGGYFGVTDDYKQLCLYKCAAPWELISTRVLARRCTSLIFSQSEDSVIVADKSGDVYRYSVTEPDKGGALLLGHLSLLLDVTLLQNDKFIATCDRDEKIRISCYPNSYNIHTYCLGHTDFVTCLLWLEDEQILISGSGDGTVRMWDHGGEQRHCIHCGSHGDNKHTAEDTPVVKRLLYCKKYRKLIVAYDGLKLLHVFSLTTNNSLETTLTQEVTLNRELWDMCLDDLHLLWVLQAEETEVISLYALDETGLNKVTDDSTLQSALTTVHKVNSNWDFFRSSLTVQTIYEILKKVRIDNMKSYLERKEQRILGKKQENSNENRTKSKKIKAS